jgi:hypothetical protein
MQERGGLTFTAEDERLGNTPPQGILRGEPDLRLAQPGTKALQRLPRY